MDKLKDFIDNNRRAFDDNDSLPEGHFERFADKLPAAPRRNRFRLYSLWGSFAAAAVIALLMLLRIPGGTTIPQPVQKTTAHRTCDAQEEINELRSYYTMQMGEVLAQIKTLYKEDQTPGTTELLKETKKILKDNYMFEETILPTLPCSNDGLYAMTQHYNNSLESLNIMLKQMERVTNNDNK